MADFKAAIATALLDFLTIPSMDFRERQRGQLMLFMASASFITAFVLSIYFLSTDHQAGRILHPDHVVFVQTAVVFGLTVLLAIFEVKRGRVALGISMWLSASIISTIVVDALNFELFGQLMMGVFAVYIMAAGLLLGAVSAFAIGIAISFVEVILYANFPSTIRPDVFFMSIALNFFVMGISAFFAHAYVKNPLILPEPQDNLLPQSKLDPLEQWTGIVVNAMERIKTEAEFLQLFNRFVIRDPENSLSAQSQTALRKIARAGSKIRVISDNASTLMELSTGNFEVHPEEFDPSAVWREILAVKMPEAQAKGSYIRFQLDPSVPTDIYHDPRLIMQAVTNLIDNALQSEPRGGIDIRLCRVDDSHWSTEIRDPGHGMVWSELNNLSLIIRDGALPLRGVNLGMGLAAAYRITHKLGGEISIHSDLGEGTIVTIVLPNRYELTQ